MTTPPRSTNTARPRSRPPRVLLERLGWTYVPREALAAERSG